MRDRVRVTIPQPVVVFLRSNQNTPESLTWDVEFFDGQKVTLKIPTIRLSEMSIKEMSERNLFPIGQFYLRKFEPLTKKNIEEFRTAADELLAELKNVMDAGVVPYNIAVHMHETIRMTLENVIEKSKEEVDVAVTTNIVETLPWIDFGEVFKKLEERGRAEGRAEGIAEGEAKGRAEGIAEGRVEGIAEGEAKGRTEARYERDMEIALKVLERQKQGGNVVALSQHLKDLGISDEVIEAARRQHDTERIQQNRKRTERER
jgi:flagellar biosynthesis/type III secretory pathway protein FliH